MNNELRVTHVVLRLDVGGLERVVIDLLREAPHMRHRASVLCIERPGALAGEAEATGAQVISVEKGAGLKLRTFADVAEALARLSPHIIHTHQLGALFYSGIPAMQREIPVLHTEHGKQAGTWRTAWISRWSGLFASRFCCVSRDIADEATRRHIVSRDKVRIISNGIDTDRFQQPGDEPDIRQRLGIAPGAPVIGTVGRLSEIKRQDLLIRAFADIKRRRCDAHLVLVGEGPERDALTAVSRELGVGDSVHLVGQQCEREHYLRIMNIFALSSRSEGMPLAILEAWAAGVPVVASRVGGIPELVEHENNGLLFNSGDAADLANCIEALLEDPDRARRLADSGRARVLSSYRLTHMAQAYHNQYLELLR